MRLTPRNRTHPPLTDSRELPAPCVEPSHARLKSHRYRNVRFQWTLIHARRGSTRSRKSVRGGAVSQCGASAAWMRLPSLQGRTCGVPALRHRPANPRNAALAVAVAGQRPALPRVQGRRPAEPPHSATCSTCRGSGGIRQLPEDHRRGQGDRAHTKERGMQRGGRAVAVSGCRTRPAGCRPPQHRNRRRASSPSTAGCCRNWRTRGQSRRVTVFITVNCSELTAPKNASCSRRRPGAGPVSSG